MLLQYRHSIPAPVDQAILPVLPVVTGWQSGMHLCIMPVLPMLLVQELTLMLLVANLANTK